MRSPLILAAAFSLAAGARGFAQTRPLATEEASTAAAGTVVLEAGASAISDEPNFLTGATRDRWDGAGAAPRVLARGQRRARRRVDGPRRAHGTIPTSGTFPTSATSRCARRCAWPAARGAETRSACGSASSLPQTSFGNGLGPNALRMSAQVLASKSVGGATVHLNAGLAIHDEPLRAHEQRDFFAYGAALTWPIGRITLVGEVAGLAGDGSPGADARSEARAGLRVGTGRLRGDIAARRGLTDSAGEWGITAGVSWTLRGP